VFRRDADLRADTVYVIGGLYGNLAALEAILQMAMCEPDEPTLVFNGDFNWFNADAMSFEGINRVVLQHLALRGNVETELAANADDAGCGCAYPDYVDDADVERSNQIMRRLRQVARATPASAAIADELTQLPMHAVAEVGDQRIGIVHGDAESLSGWRFAHDSLHEAANVQWLQQVCIDARLAGFASSHTCLPTLRRYGGGSDGGSGASRHFVINNGAAGMPNFAFTQYGLITRISTHAAPEGMAQYGDVFGGVHVDALPVHYNAAAFEQAFLATWPPGSAAHQSYYKRIAEGPAYAPPHALGLVRAPSVCA
jgi:hypothetical protein